MRMRAALSRLGGQPGAGVELPEKLRVSLPQGFEAVGEALASGDRTVEETCRVVGRAQAEVGMSLGESLDQLRSTTQLVERRDPTFVESQALASAWSDATLSYLHSLSCSDPLTGLATQAHLRAEIAGLYRGTPGLPALGEGGNPMPATIDVDAPGRPVHALVVTEANLPEDPVGSARQLTLVGDTARSVFPGAETIGRIGPRRVVVLAPRDPELAGRVALLRRMLDHRVDRVWIEGLPPTDDSAAILLDELARA